MASRQQRFLRRALIHTYKSEHMFPMAALLTIGSRVIHCGVNKTKSHSRQVEMLNPKRNIHAELSCILGLPEEVLEGSVVYVVRRLVRGIGLAKPCRICETLLRNVGVKYVVYTVQSEAYPPWYLIKYPAAIAYRTMYLG